MKAMSDNGVKEKVEQLIRLLYLNLCRKLIYKGFEFDVLFIAVLMQTAAPPQVQMIPMHNIIQADVDIDLRSYGLFFFMPVFV